MDQNKKFSKEVYNVEDDSVSVGDRLINNNYFVLDTIDTNKDTLNMENKSRNWSSWNHNEIFK